MDPTQGGGERKTSGEVLTPYVGEGGTACHDARDGDLHGQLTRNSPCPKDSRFTPRARTTFLRLGDSAWWCAEDGGVGTDHRWWLSSVNGAQRRCLLGS
jgi:hypothetical protein